VGADGVPAGSQEPGGRGGGEDGVPIGDVPPELLISFGRGSPDAGAAAGAATDEELHKALELLAEHASQVDQMIQDEESQALSAGGDRGVGPEGGGFAGAGEPAKAGIAGGIGADSAVTPYSENDPSASPGASGSGGGYRPPPQGIGDGSDDDTFAAQLREIAMNEADPELRERYWDEYRKYKGLK
jgi:hypothetical protein